MTFTMATPASFKRLVATKKTTNFREAVELVSGPMPKPAVNEVLVKVMYVGVTPDEILITSGRVHVDNADPPYNTGLEGAGVVIEKGADVEGVNVGQPVVITKNGAFSEYIIVKWGEYFPLPFNDLKPEMMCLGGSAVTSVLALDKVGEIRRGENVLITGAAGSTGSVAVQWAKTAGCHVIGTCSTDEKVAVLQNLGCDRPINIKTEDLKEVLKEEYPTGLDVVYDGNGGEVFDICAKNLAIKGRLVVIGLTAEYNTNDDNKFVSSMEKPINIFELISKSASIRGFNYFEHTDYFEQYYSKLTQLYSEGAIKTIVDNGVNDQKGPFKGFESIADAVAYVLSRKAKGKVVVDIS